MKFLLFIFLATVSLHAQTQVRAKVVDKTDGTGMALAGVKLIAETDSTKQFGTMTSVEGDFRINDVPAGAYFIRVTSVGFDTYERRLTVSNEPLNLGIIELEPGAILTKEVDVTAKQIRVEQKGDTTQFNADAYKVNPDASAEDLLRKMPGVEVQNGTVKAQGENIKKVLIDGKEFFGDDPAAALKNLPAEIIQKIEVFDRQSDQSQFSGFDDGNTEKTINIITRSGKANGEFGKVYAGYGTNDRYTAGGNINYFKDDTRLSFIGLSNNINQQNFASDDLLGVLGSSNSGGRGGRRGGNQGGGGADNFLVNGQSGITKTNAFGLNYIDKWGEKWNVSASYFFNQTNNRSLDTLDRTTFISENNRQFYRETGQDYNKNLNHRMSARLEYRINPKNQLTFTPRLSFQGNNSISAFSGATKSVEDVLVNAISSAQTAERAAISFNGNALFRHRFEKRGRTFSVGIGTNLGDKKSAGTLLSENSTYAPRERYTKIDQISNDTTTNASVNLRVDFTEPISQNGQLQFSYNSDFNANEAAKRTFDFDTLRNQYDSINKTLSNTFLNNVNKHAGGFSYRYSKGKQFSFNARLNLQYTELLSDQTFPITANVNRTFLNLLPFAMLRMQLNKGTNLRMYYRTSTNVPSITQLQNVVNNKNPLQLKAGNPDLIQEYSHLTTVRYNATNAEKATSFFAFLNVGFSDNNISNSVFTATSDTLFRGILLAKGSQLTLPINYGRAWNASSLATYGFPLKAIKSNISVNAGVNYNRIPTLVNDNENIANNLGLNAGLVVGSNISQYVDFTVGYNGTYNIVDNSLNPQLNNNYYSQNVSLKLNLLSAKGLLFSTEGVNYIYRGLADFNQNYTLLNMSVGQKFLKNKLGELKLTAFDVLNQNSSINRTVTETYIEDRRSLVLNRYFMLTFTYNLRNFR